MATLRLDEVIVDAVVAKLQAFWQPRIDAISVEKADGIVCVAPDRGFYFTGRMTQLPGAPAVFILAGTGTFREEGAHSMKSTYEIHVHIVEQGQTGPELARRLMRQARAVIEVLYDEQPQESLYVAGSDTVKSAFRIFPLRTIPGSVFQPSGPDGWRGTYVIVFRAEQEEN
jgi:hypothetical protein